VYGDQRGNGRPGLPGNLYRYQYEMGRALFESLPDDQKRAASFDRAPFQTRIELQGGRGSFPGVPLEKAPAASLSLAGRLVEGILSTYDPDDAAYARDCLEHNGGVKGLSLSYYREADDGGIGNAQIFRLEGPAAVFHFRGYPHVHAFINVARDGDRPLSVGEELGINPAPIEGAAVKRLFEDAMRESCGADFGFYGGDSVVGGLRAGMVRSGDVYTMESWQESIRVVHIQGSRLKGPLLDQLRRDGVDIAPDRVHTVATAGYVEGASAERSMDAGKVERTGIMVRDAAVSWLRAHGFGPAPAASPTRT
jgi:hypothetical protein